ncbi:L-threonylcarbamoyladenylate synthase [Aquisphaera giovannonii]|uniref:L-threonylcarbamoyladenylate synthase n=1 Tax=Aquisphaera giovannonii TaxID=406548 RepID=UPI0011DF37BE|nr:L-threonylcarbamoyladenylate synthase [Aquisphaera giovannonii]
MQTRVIQLDRERPDSSAIVEAADVLRRGGLVAFATETVYGLGAIATEPRAVRRIFEAKGRPSFNPLIVHVDGMDRARECSLGWDELASELATRFWPGPLSLILPRSRRIPDEVTAGRPTVAVRMPATPVALALIGQLGAPLAAPSANRSNRISPTRAEHVLADLDHRVDLILDTGPTSLGLESTVLDLTTVPPRILRPGPLMAPEIEAAIRGLRLAEGPSRQGHEGTFPDATAPAASPGMLPVHYAPTTPAYRIGPGDDPHGIVWPDRSALLIVGELAGVRWPREVPRIVLAEPTVAARELYATLHDLDARGLQAIFVAMPPLGLEWAAIRDRLHRATRPLVEQLPLDVEE